MSNFKHIDARERVIGAVFRFLEADRAEPHANADAEAEYAGELLALAARELAEATDAMPADRQPVGWNKANGEVTV